MHFQADDAKALINAILDAETSKAGRDFILSVVDGSGKEVRGRVQTAGDQEGLILNVYADGSVHHETVSWGSIRRISVELADD